MGLIFLLFLYVQRPNRFCLELMVWSIRISNWSERIGLGKFFI